MEKTKILQIVPSLSLSNGVAAYLMNYYQHMNLENFETTILVLNEDNKGRYEAFENLGCKIIEMFKTESWPEYIKRVKKLFEDNRFDIVHCHAPNYGAFYMHYAKKNGVNVRILHSHSNRYADSKVNAIRNFLLFKIAVKNSNYYLACSKEAGSFLFKRKKFEIMFNAIDFSKYKYNAIKREEIRKELNLENNFVLGNVGRLCKQKNQLFAIDVLKELLKQNSNSKLVLIGDGELKDKIESKISELKLENNVMLLDSMPNVNEYYNCFDAFLFPSTFEGLGIVLIEAQVNSLPSYTSAVRVPELAKISPLLKYIELEKGAKAWADYILNDKDNARKDCYDDISKSSFNIENEAKELEMYYIKSIS